MGVSGVAASIVNRMFTLERHCFSAGSAARRPVTCTLMDLPMFGNRKRRPVSGYEGLRQRVIAGDPSVDLTALRFAYMETPQYSPYEPEIVSRDALIAVDEGNLEKALTLAGRILENDFTNGGAHVAAAICHREFDDPAQADFHRKLWMGLYDSICRSGDGKSPETALTVINIEEEYFFLYVSELIPVKQDLVCVGDKSFDVIEVQDSERDKVKKAYFDVSLFYGKY